MATTLTSVLVVGPSGSVGIKLCHALVNQKADFKRIAAFRNTDRAGSSKKDEFFEKLASEGLEIVSGSYSDVDAFRGFDVVLMLLGNHGLHLQPQIIDTAIAAGVRHFYPSEFGADLLVGDNWNQRYYLYKVQTREHLEKRAKDTLGLGWTYVEIGRITEYGIISQFGVDNKNFKANIYGSESSRQSLLGFSDLIDYTIATLLDPFEPASAASSQRTYRFNGGTYTWKEIFDTLEKIRGRKYDVTYIPVEQAIEKERKAKATGNIDLELEASHQLIQGREGTLLPPAVDNAKFPHIRPKGLEVVMRDMLLDPENKSFLGL